MDEEFWNAIRSEDEAAEKARAVRYGMVVDGVEDVRAVAKAGDTERDIGEALNAGCHQAIGVLSGADSREVLEACGASMVVDNITQVQLAL